MRKVPRLESGCPGATLRRRSWHLSKNSKESLSRTTRPLIRQLTWLCRMSNAPGVSYSILWGKLRPHSVNSKRLRDKSEKWVDLLNTSTPYKSQWSFASTVKDCIRLETAIWVAELMNFLSNNCVNGASNTRTRPFQGSPLAPQTQTMSTANPNTYFRLISCQCTKNVQWSESTRAKRSEKSQRRKRKLLLSS